MPQVKTHSTKLLLIGYVALALLFSALWYVDTQQINKQHELINTTDLSAKKMAIIADLIEIARKRVRLSHEMISYDDLFRKDEIYLTIESLAGQFAVKLSAFKQMQLTSHEKEILKKLDVIYPEVVEQLDNLYVHVLEETDQGNIIARNLIIHEIVPQQERVVDGFMLIMNNIQNEVTSATVESAYSHRRNVYYRYVLIAVIFIASLGILLKVMKLIHNIEKGLKSDSLTDGLTGIDNRRCFDYMLAHEWSKAKRCKEPLSILLIDIDHFKNYNDFYGHQDGDQCLVEIAKSIKNIAHRECDTTARYGGEEFAIILPDTNTAGALTVANNILDAIRARKLPHEKSETTNSVTVSIGIATAVPSAENNGDSLVKAADEALYASKNNGRDRATIHSKIIINSLT